MTTDQKAPAKKTAPKKSAAKKTTSSTSKVSLGDTVFVDTDPRHNNGASQAPAVVTQVLDVKGETRVNLRVDVDGSAPIQLRNVLVTPRKGKARDEAETDGQRVAFQSAS